MFKIFSKSMNDIKISKIFGIGMFGTVCLGLDNKNNKHAVIIERIFPKIRYSNQKYI